MPLLSHIPEYDSTSLDKWETITSKCSKFIVENHLGTFFGVSCTYWLAGEVVSTIAFLAEASRFKSGWMRHATCPVTKL